MTPAPLWLDERVDHLEEAAEKQWWQGFKRYAPAAAPPSPPPTPPAAGGGLHPLIAVGNGAGNQPPRGANAFVAQRLVPHPQRRGRKLTALHFKAKETDGGYSAGTPRWRLELHSCRQADGLFDASTLLAAANVDARTLIGSGGGGGDCVWNSLGGLPWDAPVWLVVKDIDGDSASFASVNFLRGVPSTGQRHVTNEWLAADAGKRTLWGLDPRSVVYHDDTYVSTPTFGWYNSSRALYMVPTYVAQLDDGSYDGQPFYGAWGQVKPTARFMSFDDGQVTGIVGTGSGTVTVKTAAGTRTANLNAMTGPALVRFSQPLARKAGEYITVSINGTFRSMAMDSNWHRKFGQKIVGWDTNNNGSYGIAPVSPVDW